MSESDRSRKCTSREQSAMLESGRSREQLTMSNSDRSREQLTMSESDRSREQLTMSESDRSRERTSRERPAMLENGRSREQSAMLEKGRSPKQLSMLESDTSMEQSAMLESGRSREQSAMMESGRSREQSAMMESGRSREQSAMMESGRSREQSAMLERGRSGEQLTMLESGRSREQSAMLESGRSRERTSREQSAMLDSGRSREQSAMLESGRSTEQSAMLDSAMSTEQSAMLESGRSTEQSAMLDSGRSRGCSRVFALVLTAALVHLTAADNFTVGYLMTDRGTKFVKNKQGRIISGAMTYAIRQINNDPTILPGHRLNFIYSNTNADTLNGTRSLTEQWRDGAVAFFGPEDSCDVEARVAAAWNLPIISYKCADHRVSDKALYPTFARTFPPATQVTRSIIGLLHHFRWYRLTLVVGTSGKWLTIAEKLTELSADFNITINGRFEFTEPYMPGLEPNPFPKIVSDSFIDTRVYVFLGEHNGMVDMMMALDERGLLATGEYVVIHTNLETFDNIDPLKYFKRTYHPPIQQPNLEAVRSLLVIVGSPPSNPNYYKFQEMVNYFNEEPPFTFPNPFHHPKKITVYAAYLYDSVFLYARALHDELVSGGDPRNGHAIMARIRGESYTSIQGFLSYIDENGDAEGNYTVLARLPYTSRFSNYSMLPVGHFQIGYNHSQELPTFKLFREKHINWVAGFPPLDEPPCGYRGEKCIPPPQHTVEIVSGVIGGLVFITIVVALAVYRNWRYEQEIAGLLWKIDLDDIQGLNQTSMYGSKMTLATQGSFDSRISMAQVFTITGSYKGQVVALKKYIKRSLDINRSVKKEMKLMRDLRHDNVNAFLGACIDPPYFLIVSEYGSKGSLQDILENDDYKLDSMFVASLVMDLIKGMIFVHDNELHTHGNLKSSNCVVNSRWVLQVADFGLLELRQSAHEDDDHIKYRNRLWTAPELLRTPCPPSRGTQKGDIYSFSIILYEIIGRAGPFGDCNMSPKELVHRVQFPTWKELFRPNLERLECQDYVRHCMQECWHEIPEARPDFRSIRSRLKPMTQGMKRNIFDNMMVMMEKYQRHLEDLVGERTDQLMEEKRKTESLLHRMLPKYVADQLVSGQAVVPEAFSCVTIYFSDICGFTSLSAESSPMQVVDLLNDLYTLFDSIIHNYDVYKVETIGDAYMVASGLPLRNADQHAGEIASMSLHLLSAIKSFRIRHMPDELLKLRIGIHSGSCVAGVVGLTMPRYCLFGDTVNTTSRMESNGLPLKIHVSERCRDILVNLGGYTLEPRGCITMKGKGEVFTYWLVEEDKYVRQARLSHNPSLVSCPNMSPTQTRKRTCNITTGSRAGSLHEEHTRPVVAPDTNVPFYDLLRESKTSLCSTRHGSRHGPHHRRAPSLNTRGRRRSFDSRAIGKDSCPLPGGNANGYLPGGGGGGVAPPTCSPVCPMEPHALPSIVVERDCEQAESEQPPDETVRLLESGLATDQWDHRSRQPETYGGSCDAHGHTSPSLPLVEMYPNEDPATRRQLSLEAAF